jgi:hypothetical protein
MSKKIVKITESQLKYIVENVSKDIYEFSENEIDEGFMDTVKQPFQKLKYGLKGLRGGYGYDYMAFIVELRNILKDLKNIDRPNEKIMIKLDNLKTKILASSMRPDLKQDMENAIVSASRSFRRYQKYIDKLFITANQTLKVGGSLKGTPTPTATVTTTP